MDTDFFKIDILDKIKNTLKEILKILKNSDEHDDYRPLPVLKNVPVSEKGSVLKNVPVLEIVPDLEDVPELENVPDLEDVPDLENVPVLEK